jgi:hypothetical protein
MNEMFLQYLWLHSLIDFNNLYTREGLKVCIIKKGYWNKGAGPDFLDAQIKIGDTLWAGHIEIHLKTSLWLVHKHDYDDKYKNVILHVVLEDDAPELLLHIPHVILKNKFDHSLYIKYEQWWMAQPEAVICSAYLPNIPSIIINNTKERAMIERWETKYQKFIGKFETNQINWRSLCYEIILHAFGFKINQTGCERLAENLPLNILEKHKDNLFQLEALIFGQAHLIPNALQDNFTSKLEQEYHFLRRKYNLIPINGSIWNFSKLRPVNFPTIRLAQFAHFLYQLQFNFEFLLRVSADKLERSIKALNISTSAYFDTHYRLSSPTTNIKKKNIGDMSIQHLLINAIIPLRFWYHKIYGKTNEDGYENAISALYLIKPEINNITKLWPLKIENAFDSQSLIQIITSKCQHKKCLECSIGHYIFKST